MLCLYVGNLYTTLFLGCARHHKGKTELWWLELFAHVYIRHHPARLVCSFWHLFSASAGYVTITGVRVLQLRK